MNTSGEARATDPMTGTEPGPATPGAEHYDVVVVGGGNAGFCAAHSARDRGARVLVLEKGSADQAGGNSFYTAGAFRVSHPGGAGLSGVLDDASLARLGETDLAAYTTDDFTADMERVTGGRCDPGMVRNLVDHSWDIVTWLHAKGMRWRLMYERQAYVSNGRWVFHGGLALGTVDGGKGLIARHTEIARDSGVGIRYGATVRELLRDDSGAVCGVSYTDPDGRSHTVEAASTVLTAGGFEASPQLRQRYLGAGWEQALVRGNPLNTGEVLQRAIALGAAPYGDWASCHSVAWDAGAPPQGGDRELTNQRTRQSYPIGIVVDRDGLRFVDEGADYRNYTYAKYGREILARPRGVAFQLFDAKTRPLLRTEEYDSRPITGGSADTLRDLAAQLGIDPDGLTATVTEFNKSIVDVPFDPAVKDGRAARVEQPKSNWAQSLDTPPYYGYAVSCGITFTFGGLAVDSSGRVLTEGGGPIEGLYAAGEIVGGLFSGNYPGGSGLTAGSVYGRLAGDAAATDRRST
ncbi:FAD-dependent tricarballylate dehydrogenase TcuA [Streptomonospora salina]